MQRREMERSGSAGDSIIHSSNFTETMMLVSTHVYARVRTVEPSSLKFKASTSPPTLLIVNREIDASYCISKINKIRDET